MAVGRITGPLLAKNLLRDGVDLAFENDLLYLDVKTGRIGIKTATPEYTLDVNGTFRVNSTAQLSNLTVSSSATATSLTNSLGNIIIQSPVEGRIYLQNDTLIKGNLHATGNITANGSVQIGNMTGSDTLSLFADIISDITPQTPHNYNLGAPERSWANAYVDNIVAGAITGFAGQELNIGQPPGQDPNVSPTTNPVINLNGNVRIWGSDPLGTAPVVSNVLYVSMDGSDTNDGRAADATRACRTISGAVRSPFYQSGTSIKVAPGHYYENNPIELKPYTSVIGSDLRTTSIEPIHKTQDLFHVQSGCYLNYMQFVNGQSGLLPGPGYTPGTNRGAYAAAFPPNYGGEKIVVYHSPYIQNCTNQSGPWLQDGTMFNPNQTIQVPEAIGNASWDINTTTLLVTVSEGTISVGQSINIGPQPLDYVNARTLMLANKAFIQEQVIAYIDQTNTYFGYNKTKCARDTGLIIDSMIADLVFPDNGYTQSNFAGLQYWNQAGRTGDIQNELTTTTNAINFVSTLAQEIIQNITSGPRYQSTLIQTTGTPSTPAQAVTVAYEFGLITTILNSGPAAVTDLIVPNGVDPISGDPTLTYDLLQANRAYIQAEALAYINTQNLGFTYDQAKCERDVGFMVDSVSFDILYGGNRQAIQSGTYYWGFSDTSSVVAAERPQVTAAYYRIKDIVGQIITNQAVTRSPGNVSVQTVNLPAATSAQAVTLRAMVDRITEIINAGPDGALAPNSISLTKSTSTYILNAVEILQANKSFITSEVISYIDRAYNSGFAYNQPKCYRDTGLIVDSIAADILYEGDGQSTFAGLQYWNQTGYTGDIANEITTTTAAVKYVTELALQIIQVSTGTRYQSSLTQVISGFPSADEPSIKKVAEEFGIISDILTAGPEGATDVIVANGAASTASQTLYAYSLLQTNKAYIQAEAVAFVETTKTPGFIYDQAKCHRDVGYMVDSVCFDLLHGGTRQAVQSGVSYYSFNSTSTSIPNEIPQTTAAYNHIRNIVGKIITGQTISPTSGNTATQVISASTATSAEITLAYEKIDSITNIINNGPSVAGTLTPISLTASTATNLVNAYELLIANKTFIQEETIAFVNQFNVGFKYNRAKCSRDVGIIVENLAYDIAFGGNEKSVESGLAYWNGVTSYIPNEITQTADAINYINTLSQSIITNTTATNLLNTYQTAPQVINTALTGGATASDVLTKLVAVINNIIETGPEVAPAIQVGNGPDWGSVSAEVLLQTNRKFIQTEVVNWVNQYFPGFVYREDLCFRDTGLIIDAISQDIILNANAKSIESAVTYWTGNKSVIANATYGNKDQVVETTAALAHAKQVALQVINNTTATASAFTFNPTKCSRDTGLIVDALAQDLLFGGSSQSTFAGVQYWNHGGYVGNIANEISTTTAAINYVNSIAQKVVVCDTSSVRYSTGTQNVSLPAATLAQAAAVDSEFSTITNILINGVVGVTDSIIPNSLTASTNMNDIRAYNLLQANKSYLQDEAIAWIDSNMSFRYNETKCSRDTGLIVDSIAFDLAYPTEFDSQSTFAGLQYWNQDGYTGQISSEVVMVSNSLQFMNSLLSQIVQNDTGGVRYSTSTQVTSTATTGTSVEATAISVNINLMQNILEDGTAGVTDQIVSNNLNASTSTNVVGAYTLLQLNKTYITDEVIAFIDQTNPGFTYTVTTCRRDVGYILDSLSFDLLHSGNRQSIQSAVYYYDFDATSTAIPDEVPQTIAAYEFIKAISQRIVSNEVITPMQTAVSQVTTLPPAAGLVAQTISDKIEKIINIIENGPTVIRTKQPISLTTSVNGDELYASQNLVANKEFIKAETIAYINSRYVFQYDHAKCRRDVGYMIDSVSFDLLYGGNRQAIQSGTYYWGYNNVSTSLPSEQVASTAAYQYMKSLMTSIVTATPIAETYQSSIAQVTNLPAGTSVEADIMSANIDIITNIINNGPSIAAAGKPIGLTRSNNAYTNNAANLIEANRDFIRAEVNAYVQSNVNEQVFLPFYNKGANATLSVTRNFDLITNIIQNGPGVAPIKTDGNGIFVKTGLSLDDIKIAPVITAITTVSSGVYQVDISQSTVGYGDSQSLYFGQTAVFPLLDPDVPARWQQRRINPIGSMGGALIDGGVVSDRAPINSFVFDAFTQVNQGGIGIHVTNNGYAQLVSVFTIFCSQAVLTENGGICSITNSNSNFGDLCLISKGYGKRDFSGYIYNPPVLPYYPYGKYPLNSSVAVYIADTKLRPHIGLLMEVQPPVGFINNQGLPGFVTGNTNVGTLTTGSINITGLDTTGMVVGQTFYVRDQYGKFVDSDNQPYVTSGTIISDINFQSITLNYPLNSGGGDPNNNNYFNLYSCGNAYYTVLSSTVLPDPIVPGTLLLPNNQNAEEVTSFGYISSITELIVNNIAITPLQTVSTQVFDYTLSAGAGAISFINNELSLMGSILTNGLSSAPAITTSGTKPSGTVYEDAAGLLQANRTFIQDEVIEYVNQTFFSLNYDKVKCARDTGLIVDAIAQDLLFSTSSQSTFAAIQYWAQDGYVGAIADELTTTTNTINYVKTVAQEIVQGIVGTRYSTGTQITAMTTATSAEANTIGTDFDVITNILSTGTAGVTNIIVPNSLTSSTNVNVANAYALLQANKEYIAQEAIAYITSTTDISFTYDQSTCMRDVGFMVDSVSFDLLYGGNRQAVQSGVYYYGYSTATVINNEIPETIDAYNHISSLTQQIVLGQTVTALQTAVAQVKNLPIGTTAEVTAMQTSINTITNIIQNGPSVANGGTPISLTASTNTNVINAAKILEANRAFIKAEVIAYIDGKYVTYNRAKCRRDVGLIVDALSYDLATGGNYNAVIAGKSYYAQTGTFHLVNIEENITDPALFPDGAIINYYQRSYQSASGYLFEYVGAGTNYGSLPQRGKADPIQAQEVVQLNNGKVFFTSTDQNGDFRIGPGLVISQATGVLSGRTFTKSLFANLTPFILAIEGI